MSSTNYYTSALLAPSNSSRVQREIPTFGSFARTPQASLEEERPAATLTYHPKEQKDQRSLLAKKEERPKIITPVQLNNKADKQEEQDDKKSNDVDNDSQSSIQQQSNGTLPSYTAMIAQAILSREGHRSTLCDIYEYMNKTFPALERRGTGWRNCVRHTLSLNDCFIKLHRPENGRSCNWAVHPTYFESFSRGDYRKRRSIRKRTRNIPWLDSTLPYPLPYFREQDYLQQHQPSTGTSSWQFNSANTQPSWNATQQGYYNQSHTTAFNQPSMNVSPQDYRQAYYNNHASCHYMDPNCYCFNQKGNNRFLS
eukprot:gene20015-21976_t